MLYFFCVECRDNMPINKKYNAYSVVITHGKYPRVAFAFARQPWAIKSTTPTALHHEGIYIAKYIHWNTGTMPTASHHEGIFIAKYIHWDTGATPTALCIRIFVTAYRLIRAIDVVEN